MSREKILIVDDDEIGRKLSVSFLKSMGYGCTSLENAKEILEKTEAYDPNLILLDIMMPEISGFQACRLLKMNEKTADIPVIFLSAIDSDESISQAMNAGGDDYLSKPFKKNDLEVRIKLHLERRQAGLQRKKTRVLTPENHCYPSEYDFTQGMANIDFSDLLAPQVSNCSGQNEELLRIILNNHPATVVLTDLQGNIQYVNPMFVESTGYSIDEVLGENPRVLKSGEMPGEAYSDLWKTISSGKTWRGEFHNKRKDGTLFWEKSSIAPIFDSDGKITHYLAVKENIDEQKAMKAERDLLQQEKEKLLLLNYQREKLASLGELTSGVAHEINNPANFVLLNVDILEDLAGEIFDELKSNAERRKEFLSFLQGIREGGLRIRNIVAGLKEYSAVDVLSMQELDLVTLVKNLLPSLDIGENKERNSLEHKRVIIETDESEILVEGNKKKLEQVVVNLVENSLRALENPDEKVLIRLTRKRRKALLEVEDHGKGIPTAIMAKVMDPFFTTYRSKGGTGLGLSICQRIVKEHGGFIAVEQAMPKGTLVKVTFPLFDL